MGREATITYEQVAAAADAMKITGSKPTSRSIRERLGNTGSMGTINKHLQAWKAGQERQISNALTLPPVLQRAILEFMDQELTSAKATLEADLSDALQESADLATENERQAADIEDKNETLTTLQTELANRQGRIGQIEIDLDTAKDEADRERKAAEAARTELAKALLRLEAMPRLEADLIALRADLEKERQGRVTAEQNAAVLAATLAGAETELANLQKRADKIETSLGTAKDEGTKERQMRVAAEQQAAVLTATLGAANNRVTVAEAAAAEATKEAKKAREEAAELRGKNASGTGTSFKKAPPAK